MVETRAGTKSTDDTPQSNIDDLLKPLQEYIDKLEKCIEEIKCDTAKKLTYQEAQIINLQTRINNLEDESSFTKHLLELTMRRLDDLEQYGRKVNLRLNDISVFDSDSPLKIMNHIKEEVGKLNLDIGDKDYDRCHRIGDKYVKDGVTCQSVILRMCSWTARNSIFVNRKALPFFIVADLTAERQRTLNQVKDELSIWSDTESSKKVFSYVFVDDNCKLKLKAKTGKKKYYSFSTYNEYLSLVFRLDNSVNYTDEVVVGDYVNRIYC